MSEEIVEPKELPVTFQPALVLQRRAWVFQTMRREGVKEVLDIGCGEGETISCLCNPAPWIAPPPDYVSSSGIKVEDWLHVERIYACDVSSEELKFAIEGTAPRTRLASNILAPVIRWEPLEVKVWEGGLESYNPEFVGVECIVATEVVEHLPEEIHSDFAPVILGLYHPRLLLITTPSYTFNARFTAPDAPFSARDGVIDPTGRTERKFRHWDHKFEWTVEEFTEWCQAQADEWGYKVEMSGVGRAQETDEWGRDDELGWASQTAAFVRKEGEDLVKMREEKCKKLGILGKASNQPRHQLRATYQHEPNARARKPLSVDEIGNLVAGLMQRVQEERMSIHELWFEEDINQACGGYIHLLAEAVDAHSKVYLHQEPDSPLKYWKVELVGFTKEQQLWPREDDEENAPSRKESVSQWDDQEWDGWGRGTTTPTRVADGTEKAKEWVASGGWGDSNWASAEWTPSEDKDAWTIQAEKASLLPSEWSKAPTVGSWEDEENAEDARAIESVWEVAQKSSGDWGSELAGDWENRNTPEK